MKDNEVKYSNPKLVAMFYGKNGELIAKYVEGEPIWYLNEDVKKAFEKNIAPINEPLNKKDER